MNYYLQAFQNYSNFVGRARRSEYWYFVLFNIIFALCAMALGVILQVEGALYGLYALITFIPGLAVAVRRLHDVGKSGWFFLILLIPVIGAIWMLILLLTDSDPGSNEYGHNPKEM